MSNPSSIYRLVSDRAPSGVRYWRVYFKDPFSGKLRKISTGVEADGSKASAVKAHELALLVMEDARRNPPPPPPARMTLGDYARDFWVWDRSEYLKARLARDPKAISQEHAKNQVSALRCHVEPWSTPQGVRIYSMVMSEIGPDVLDELVTDILSRGRSTQTAKHVIHALGPIFRWALRKKSIKVDPVPSMMPFAVRSQERDAFTLPEARALLNPKTVARNWGNPGARSKVYRDGWRMYALSVLEATTSARWGSVIALTAEDIRLAADGAYWEVTLDKSLGEVQGIKAGSKTGRGTVVPVAREVLDLVMAHLPESGPLFPSWGAHGVLTHHPAGRAIRAAMERIGISRATQKRRLLGHHSWRHTFETRARAAGLAREIRSAFTEHRSDDVADGYAHLLPFDLLGALPVQRELIGSV